MLRPALAFLWLGLLLATTPGCSLFRFKQQAHPLLAEDGPSYSVEFHPHGGEPQRLDQKLDGPLVVSDALSRVNASRRFNRMNIFIVRKGADGRGVKLQVNYDRVARAPAGENDYALHPGDRVIVIEDTSTAIDDMVGSVFGPIGRAFGG